MSQPYRSYDEFADLLSTCEGDGSCIAISDRRHPATAHRGPWRGFYRDEGVACAHGCAPQPCLNLRVCGTYGPAWFLGQTDGLCVRCAERGREKID